MNIGFITPQISREKGGISNTSYLFMESFPKRANFHAFCAKDSDIVPGNENKIIYSKFNQNQTIGLHLDIILKVFKQNRKQPFDFSFTSLCSYGVPCYLLKKCKGVPYGVMIHGNEVMEEPKRFGILGRIKRFSKTRFKRLVVSNADVIFANSSYTKTLFETHYGKANIEIIHPPIKFVDKEGEKDSVGIRFNLLSIGRIVERKGFQFVIEAMEDLVKVYPMLKYYIAGSGPYSKTLEELVNKLNLSRNVFLLGRVSEEEKEKLYKECDLFIMPSFIIESEAEVEGFGIVFIEANMFGKYVIATKTGGIPDAIIEGVTGQFVEEQNHYSIAEAIRNFYNHSFCYSKKKCIMWAQELDVDVIIEQYLTCFSRILGDCE